MSGFKLKKTLFAAVGCFLLGAGIGLCDHSGLGTDPFTVLLVGMRNHLGGTIGIMNAAVNLCMILFGLAVDRHMVSISTFIAMAMTSIGIDTVGVLIPGTAANALNAWLALIAGILIYSFGSSSTIAAAVGYDPYNCFLMGLRKLFHLPYKVIRWGVEILFLVCGWMMGGIVGIGTVLTLVAVAPLVERISGELRLWISQFSN